MRRTEHHDLEHGGAVLRLDAAAKRPAVMLDYFVEGPRAWTRDTISPSQWTVEFTGPAADEIASVLESMRQAPRSPLLLRPAQFRLPTCRAVMARVKSCLNEGVGLAVLERLPMAHVSAEEAEGVFWILGSLLATPVATKWDGTMLYHVTDTGRQFGYGVRGSTTNVELSFHTDNAFGIALPDYVGLLCINPAVSGGVSRFCSLYTVHNELLKRHPRLLRRLYEPAYYDRQAEHAPDAPKVLWVPLFRYDGGQLSARLTPNLIRRGYEMAGVAMDAPLVEALECLEEVLAREDLWVEFTLERGQIQYLHNLWCAHFRSAFTDSEDPARKRFLIRGWYREHGGRAYDG